jgi:hypothetical protein
MRWGVLVQILFLVTTFRKNAPPHSPYSSQKEPCHPEYAAWRVRDLLHITRHHYCFSEGNLLYISTVIIVYKYKGYWPGVIQIKHLSVQCYRQNNPGPTARGKQPHFVCQLRQELKISSTLFNLSTFQPFNFSTFQPPGKASNISADGGLFVSLMIPGGRSLQRQRLPTYFVRWVFVLSQAFTKQVLYGLP